MNGYECIAINPDYFKSNYGQVYPTNRLPYDGYHPVCTTQDPAHNYVGRDTGYAYWNVQPKNSTTGQNIILVTTHLVGFSSNLNACRTAQYNGLKNQLGFSSAAYALYAGDWNTDPNASSDPVAPTMRATFAGGWGTPAGSLANEIDNPSQPTAFYVNGTNNLDHVFGRGFNGNCTRGGNFDGTDHTWTDCQVYSLSYQP